MVAPAAGADVGPGASGQGAAGGAVEIITNFPAVCVEPGPAVEICLRLGGFGQGLGRLPPRGGLLLVGLIWLGLEIEEAKGGLVGGALAQVAGIHRFARKDIAVHNLIAYTPVDQYVVEAQEGSCSLGKLAVIVVETWARMPGCHIHYRALVNVKFWAPLWKGCTHHCLVSGEGFNELREGKCPVGCPKLARAVAGKTTGAFGDVT